MFLNWTFSFLIFFTSFSVLAYSNSGVERISPTIILRLAEKEGFTISLHERAVKNQLLRLKKKNIKDFKEKLGQGIENPESYQGYLLEIQDGLTKIEKAKKIARFELFKKVEKNWNDLKLTVLNPNVAKNFKEFQLMFKKDLNSKLVYTGTQEVEKTLGYHFEIGQWATVTVSPALKTVYWKIEFNNLHDNNKLEKGAEDIQIAPDSSSQGDESPTSFDDETP